MSLTSKLAKQLGLNIASSIAEMESNEYIKTRDPSLTWALCGGFARGRVNVLAGDSGSGKTTIAMLHAAETQKEDEESIVVVIDTEYYYHKKPKRVLRLKQFGLDLDRVIIKSTNDPGEAFQLLTEIETLMKKGIKVSSVVVDSLGGVSTKAQEERIAQGEAEKAGNQYGGSAKMIANTVRIMVRIAAENDCTIFCVQHAMEDMSNSYGPPKKIIKGGQTLRLLSDTMLLFSTINAKDSRLGLDGKITKNSAEVFSGKRIRVKIDKCRDGVEGRTAELSINFVNGDFVNKEESLFETAVKVNVIYHPVSATGTGENKLMWSYEYNNETHSVRGRPGIIQSLKNKDLFDHILQKCLDTNYIKNEQEADVTDIETQAFDLEPEL